MKKRNSLQNRKAALYDPYLDTLGGGEKHILSILKVLQESGFELHIYWDTNVSEQIKSKFNLQFSSNLIFHENMFKTSSSLQKLGELRQYEALFYVTDGSYFFSSAKNTFIFCMVPQKNLYHMNPLNRLKLKKARFISNSEFTQKWLSQWHVQSAVIYPYINDDLLKLNLVDFKKEKIILSVGRFFGHLHTKKHDVAINAFRNLKKMQKQFIDFQLILTGSLIEEDKEYFNSLVSLIGSDSSIILKPNISYENLIELYKKSLFYWHFAGYGVDEKVNPEQVEHFGITPLEAMAAYCIPFCFAAGGPKYFISSGNNGYLFKNEDELQASMKQIFTDITLFEHMQKTAHQYVVNNFSYQKFEAKVKEVILNTI